MLTEKDKIILGELRKNARTPLAEISRKNKIPLTTVFNKVKRFEKDFIVKHTSFVDFSKLGHFLKVNFILKSNDKHELLQFLSASSKVNSVYKINNNYDFLVECIFKNMGDLEDFTERLNEYSLESCDVHHIIETLKLEEFMS